MASNTSPNDSSEQHHKSGETSPEEGRSVSTGRKRSNTETTLVSSNDDTHSVSTTYHPGAPVNSPVKGSIAGDPVDHDEVLARVETIKAETASSVKENVMEASQISKEDLKSVVADVAREGVFEKDVWQGEAEESAKVGLARLGQLAKDQNARDPSKSVKEYYSEYLSRAIKAAEIEFDAMSLQ